MSRGLADDLLRVLIEADLLVPAFGSRLFFFHQSITEFLAANQFLKLYRASNDIVQAKTVYRRWDYTLTLVCSLMNEAETADLLDKMVDIDLPFALSVASTLPKAPTSSISKLIA